MTPKKYRAYLFDGTESFDGAFVEGSHGRFKITRPGPLARYDVEGGEVLDTINGVTITPDSLAYWTPRNPAKHVVHTRTDDGKTTMWDLRLSR